MNKDEKDFEARVAARLHQRERMRAWTHVAAHTDTDWIENADYMLAAFDRRFPAPTSQSATPPPPAAQAVEVAPLDTNERHDYAMLAQEVSTLCEKARLWDAVASRKVRLTCDFQGMFAALFDKGEQVGGWQTSFYTTAAEAVQAAIEAGALGPPTSDAGALK